MSILNIETLKDLARKHNLFGADYSDENFQPCSYDLRIGTIYKNEKIVSASHPESSVYFVKVKPSEIITLLTLEEVNMPQDCCGTVFAINSHSSSGLLILNPGHIDPGYKGPISICAINLSKKPIKLRLKDSIFTIILEKLDKQIPEGNRYINKEYDSRKDLEEVHYKERFSNLSNSFFDLVLGYEKANKLLVDRIYDNFKNFLKKTGGILIAIASILGGFYLIFPNSILFNLNKKEPVINENIKVIDNYKDSLEVLNYKLDSIARSIKVNQFKINPND